MLPETTRIKIAKGIDEYVGRWLIRLLDWMRLRRQQPAPQKIERILFVKFWGMGSIILAEPAMRYLRKNYPAARLDFLTLAQNRELFELIPQVDSVHALDFRQTLNFLFSTFMLIMRLRRQRYDLIFDAEFFANFSALVSRFSGACRLIGFSRSGSVKGRLLDLSVPFNDGQHAADNFLQLVKYGEKVATRFDEDDKLPRLRFLPASIGEAQFRRRPHIVMNVNASPLALERRWPAESFARLAQWLLKKYEVDLVLIGSQAERKYTSGVAAVIGARGNVKNLAGTLTLKALAALMANAALFISNDSGPLHLAAALHKPVVGFFGPETPQRFGPLCEDRLIFYLGLRCSPCMSVDNAKTVNCTNHLRCMRDLSLAMVIPPMQRFIDDRELLPHRGWQKEFLEGALSNA